MKEKTWHDYFNEEPDEEIGRFVKGVFDEPTLVILPRVSWAYVDWMKESQGCDVEEAFKKNLISWTPEYGCRHNAFKNLVFKSFLKMEKRGLPRPEWCGPADPVDLMDI